MSNEQLLAFIAANSFSESIADGVCISFSRKAKAGGPPAAHSDAPQSGAAHLFDSPPHVVRLIGKLVHLEAVPLDPFDCIAEAIKVSFKDCWNYLEQYQVTKLFDFGSRYRTMPLEQLPFV